MSTKTVVNKLTKAQLTTVLNENFKAVKKVSKEIADSIQYTAKAYKEDEKSVSKKVLLDLVKDVMNALGDKFILATDSTDISVPVLAENSVKPSGKKLSKKSKAEPKEEEPETEEKAEEPKEKAPKKSKKNGKKSAVSTNNAEEDKQILLAQTFTEEIVVPDDDGESKYEVAHDIDSIEKLIEAFNNDETIVFAFYWTSRHIKQFGYFNNQVKAQKEFPLDLDLASCIYVSDDGVVAYAVSLYTEANYLILPEDFEEFDGVRYCQGIEFQIYRLVE